MGVLRGSLPAVYRELIVGEGSTLGSAPRPMTTPGMRLGDTSLGDTSLMVYNGSYLLACSGAVIFLRAR
jgi:hypothetical protein